MYNIRDSLKGVLMSNIEFRLTIFAAIAMIATMGMLLSVMLQFVHPDTVRAPIMITGALGMIAYVALRITASKRN